jgi:hypothetical protein
MMTESVAQQMTQIGISILITRHWSSNERGYFEEKERAWPPIVAPQIGNK